MVSRNACLQEHAVSEGHLSATTVEPLKVLSKFVETVWNVIRNWIVALHSRLRLPAHKVSGHCI